jgi:hypothetical protein
MSKEVKKIKTQNLPDEDLVAECKKEVGCPKPMFAI